MAVLFLAVPKKAQEHGQWMPMERTGQDNSGSEE
jgi:hypothetical protein